MTHFKQIVIQIATPQSIGTGFCLVREGVIVTNHHVVAGAQTVVVSGDALPKQLVKVLYTDPKLDLAFLELPTAQKLKKTLPIAELCTERPPSGAEIIVIGHPFGLKYTTTQGIVSNPERLQPNGLYYLQVDAAINPGNSGGPLLDKQGRIVGVNTFIIKESNNLGFSLPSVYLAEALEEYRQFLGKIGTRCSSCSNIVLEDTIELRYCPDCGAEVELVTKQATYMPMGIAATLESVLTSLGHNVELARSGQHNWLIEQGTARILVHYDEETGFITGDAVLCSLPKTGIRSLYEFLLRRNYQLKGMSLSVIGQDVVLSTTIYDQHLNRENTQTILQTLFACADELDNILIEQYGSLPRMEEI
jgi:serine protease Do